MAAENWRPGDRVRFCHQTGEGPWGSEGPAYVVEDVAVSFGGEMVSLVGMAGQFAAHLFVRVAGGAGGASGASGAGGASAGGPGHAKNWRRDYGSAEVKLR